MHRYHSAAICTTGASFINTRFKMSVSTNESYDEKSDDTWNEDQIQYTALLDSIDEMQSIINNMMREENEFRNKKKVFLDNCRKFCYTLPCGKELGEYLDGSIKEIREIIQDDASSNTATEASLSSFIFSFNTTMEGVVQLVSYYTDKMQRLEAQSKHYQHIEASHENKFCEGLTQQQQLDQAEEEFARLCNESKLLHQSIDDTMSKINDYKNNNLKTDPKIQKVHDCNVSNGLLSKVYDI